MTPETLLLALLIAQGVIGGMDTLLNHEIIVRLPQRMEARTEIGIHVLREAAYGLLFGTLAWFAWNGTWAVVIGVLLLAAIVIDACDEFVENRTRVLPQNERLLHFLLILNLGFITIVLVPVLMDWASNRTGLVPAGHGILSWILSALALAAIGWSIRDLLAWRALSRKQSGKRTA
ncbi:hypothetical protein [Noviherbaspirillum massiliense]|uniref:hypothetical protein n=1 Tax=Noviherbaspirillum massiliense TaxID=1465823 RepID=UPI0002F75557|nr:hypothetical protein [Noviherbaspirillum massiliense]